MDNTVSFWCSVCQLEASVPNTVYRQHNREFFPQHVMRGAARDWYIEALES